MAVSQWATLSYCKGTISGAVRAMAEGVADSLFPWACVSCESPADSALCRNCLARVRWIAEPCCLACGLPLGSPPSRPCGRCLKEPPPFRRLRAVACYGASDEDHDPLGIALRALKYAGRRALAPALSTLLADRFPFFSEQFDVVAPVPLHIDRLRSRGFNQALLLAREPARRLGSPLDGGLMLRVRATPPQVGLGERAREDNVRFAFALRSGRSVEGKRVLLVDDVCTSTATVRACARALRDQGATSVDVIVLSRALPR
jgi:ComF family protein